MRKTPTGEPCAGEPHARFGGRGGATLPDPYHIENNTSLVKVQIASFMAFRSSKSYIAVLLSYIRLWQMIIRTA